MGRGKAEGTALELQSECEKPSYTSKLTKHD